MASIHCIDTEHFVLPAVSHQAGAGMFGRLDPVKRSRPRRKPRFGDAINQQLWCWGRDILHPEGNLLTQYGFVRQERPPERAGTSLYRWESSSDWRVLLWGFAIFVGDDELQCGMWLKRGEALPRWSPFSDVRSPAWEMCNLPIPSVARTPAAMTACDLLVMQFCSWVSDYEAWVVARRGIAYRASVLEAWKRLQGHRQIPYDVSQIQWRTWARQGLFGGVLHLPRPG